MLIVVYVFDLLQVVVFAVYSLQNEHRSKYTVSITFIEWEMIGDTSRAQRSRYPLTV